MALAALGAAWGPGRTEGPAVEGVGLSSFAAHSPQSLHRYYGNQIIAPVPQGLWRCGGDQGREGSLGKDRGLHRHL